ncbi:MAG: acetate--CoA ligase family protein [Candidatus Micrarchaeia archaeon]
MDSKSGAESLMDFALLEKYNIPVVPYRFATSQSQAMLFSRALGFPVALKVASTKILHKSEQHALALNLRDESAVASEYSRLSALGGKDCKILVQKFLPSSFELIAGGRMDAQFGPTIMIGLGGIYTEIMQDVSIRVAPPSDSDIRSMISGLKAFPALRGARGQSGVDLTALVKILRALSNLMVHEHLSELDINPLLQTKDGLLAADVRVLR